MKSTLRVLLFVVLATFAAKADISLPKRDNFYDKMGRGLANVALSPSEILDSQYTLTMRDGGTVGFTKGMLVQGPSRMVMDIGQGLFEIITAPFPLTPYCSYRSMKLPPYDSMVVNDYPPADLNNWY